jgi:hypothetical protein
VTSRVFWGRRRALGGGAALCATIGAVFAVLVVASWSAGERLASALFALFVVIGVAGTVSLGRGWLVARRGPLLAVDQRGVTWRGRTIVWGDVQRVAVVGEIDPRVGYRLSSGVVLVDAAGGDVLRIESGQLVDVESAAAVAAAIEDGRAAFSAG